MEFTIEDDHIHQVVKLIVDAAHPDRVILSGSRARGTSKKESDLDFLVVMPYVENEREVSRKIYHALLKARFPQAVDIVVVSRENLERHKKKTRILFMLKL